MNQFTLDRSNVMKTFDAINKFFLDYSSKRDSEQEYNILGSPLALGLLSILFETYMKTSWLGLPINNTDEYSPCNIATKLQIDGNVYHFRPYYHRNREIIITTENSHLDGVFVILNIDK